MNTASYSMPMSCVNNSKKSNNLMFCLPPKYMYVYKTENRESQKFTGFKKKMQKQV